MSEPFIGEIVMFGGNFAPRSWALCDGQLLPISQYSAVFSILGTTYGGDGRTTFGLPELRGRVPVHPGSGPGVTPVNLGEKAGANTTTLTSLNLPPHTHTVEIQTSAAAGNNNSPVNNYLAADSNAASLPYRTALPTKGGTTGLLNGVSVPSSGGGSQSFNNMQPFLGVNFIIGLMGIFPSRS